MSRNPGRSGEAMRRLVGELARLSAALARRLAAQDSVIREQAALLAHRQKIIDRSSAQAKIGVWECELTGDTLTWTNGTYDLFELPRGIPITREQILAFYTPASRGALTAVRNEAIGARTGFDLDVEITTAKGNMRWIRITATIECDGDVPKRIFGMKQDVTEQKALLDRLRVLAECDALTGLANRAVLNAAVTAAAARDGAWALFLIDLDGFKRINDTYGHAAGDLCLKEVATRLRRSVRPHDLVARLGGDEFAVVIEGSASRSAVEDYVERILAELRRPIACASVSFVPGASIGVAIQGSGMPRDPSAAFIEADVALYAAKAAGKDGYRIFAPSRADATDLKVA